MKIPEKKLDPKLVAFDMDDTLLNKDLEIGEKTAASIRKLAEKGIYVVLASGRTKGALEKYVKFLGTENFDTGHFIVTLNGARIFDLRTDKVIYSRNVDGVILIKSY